MFRALLKQVLPFPGFWNFMNSNLRILQVIQGVIYDTKRYIRSTEWGHLDPRSRLRSQLITHYHALEKGLSMPEKKQVFGLPVAANLVSLSSEWDRNFQENDVHQLASKHVLSLYASHVGICASKQIAGLQDATTNSDASNSSVGGIRVLRAEDILRLSKGGFPELLAARRSIRHYSPDPVDENTILDAIKLAQESPSTCNRQGTRVMFTTNRKNIEQILGLQNGNRGFGHMASGLILIASDLSTFSGVTDRKQSAIDAGMFSMSLLYALTSLGLGACALNWSVPPAQDRKLRETGFVPTNYEVIMLISLGHIPDSIEVPYSARTSVFEIATSID